MVIFVLSIMNFFNASQETKEKKFVNFWIRNHYGTRMKWKKKIFVSIQAIKFILRKLLALLSLSLASHFRTRRVF